MHRQLPQADSKRHASLSQRVRVVSSRRAGRRRKLRATQVHRPLDSGACPEHAGKRRMRDPGCCRLQAAASVAVARLLRASPRCEMALQLHQAQARAQRARLPAEQLAGVSPRRKSSAARFYVSHKRRPQRARLWHMKPTPAAAALRAGCVRREAPRGDQPVSSHAPAWRYWLGRRGRCSRTGAAHFQLTCHASRGNGERRTRRNAARRTSA